MSNFCLSDRKIPPSMNCNYYYEEDVKEFIRLLKEEIPKLKSENYYDCCNDEDFFIVIDKLAGDKLK